MSLYQGQSDDRQRVKDASDIVRVVGEHLALKPKGREFVGLCPFHDDRNPSMAVVPAKQIFHCFVCGTGGDVFSFIQNYHSMGFREALEFLATRAGIELTNRGPAPAASDGGPAIGKAEIMRANDTAQGFFRTILSHEEHGAVARELIERRGISDEMIEAFGIGSSPDRWDGLAMTVEKKGLGERVFEAAGLLKRREGSDGCYDAMRNRLIFPIHDQIGRVVGFGGRRIDDEDEPKYLNSPETAAFRKSVTLYGLHQASRAIQQKRTAVVVEGYTDVVACHQAGVTNVVGTLGTALTSGHATVLRRLCDTVVLLFDGDEAGQRAADRAVEVLFSESIDIRVAALAGFTDAKDPDELLQCEGGAEIFERAISQSQDLLAWRFERLRAELASAGPAGVARAVETELERFSRLGLGRLSPVRRRQIVRLIAEATGLEESVIVSQLKTGRPGRAEGASRDDDPGPTTRSISDATAREMILGCVMTDPSSWVTMDTPDRSRVRPESFGAPESVLIAQAVRAVSERGGEPGLDAVLGAIDATGDDGGAGAAAWAVALTRAVEAQSGSSHERAARLLGECLRASGLEDEIRDTAEIKPEADDDAASLEAFVKRQRELRTQFGRSGRTKLTGE